MAAGECRIDPKVVASLEHNAKLAKARPKSYISRQKNEHFPPKNQHFPPKNQHNCAERDPDVNGVNESGTNFISVLTDIDIESYNNCNKISNEVTVLDECSMAIELQKQFRNDRLVIHAFLFCR
jgi:hypothetical protein